MRNERANATVLRLPLEVVAPPPAPRSRGALAVAAVLIVAACFVPLPLPLFARAGACAAIALVAWARMRSTVAIAAKPEGWVCLDAHGIVRTDEAGTRPIVRWDEPFGLTVLANEARAHAILAFTTPKQTRYLNVRVGSSSRDGGARGGALFDRDGATGDLFGRAVIVADADTQADGRAALGLRDAAKLVRTAMAKSPGAEGRIYLSDSRGAGVTLDGGALSVGERTFDLTAPLEWRGFVFHEPGAHLGTVYQGTWVRQGGQEVVLVAPMPPEPGFLAGYPQAPGQRLGPSESVPPSRELRVAIERLFMLPLRQALERAPRLSRAGAPTRGGRHAVQT